MRRFARFSPMFGAGVLAWACASPPAPVTVRVMNHSHNEIESIQMKACASDESALAPLPDTELDADSSMVIEVPSSCIDLVALDRGGEILGQQRDLRALPGTIWSIR